jgi:hypothetical protein
MWVGVIGSTAPDGSDSYTVAWVEVMPAAGLVAYLLAWPVQRRWSLSRSRCRIFFVTWL